MKEIRKNKGITLLVLIITIVILLILAAVIISSIQNYEILDFANKAVNTHIQKQEEEIGILDRGEKYLNNTLNGNTEDADKCREGEIVKYDSDKDGVKEDWIVLTDRKGLVEIISTTAMGSLTLGPDDTSVKVTTDLDGNGSVDKWRRYSNSLI